MVLDLPLQYFVPARHLPARKLCARLQVRAVRVGNQRRGVENVPGAGIAAAGRWGFVWATRRKSRSRLLFRYTFDSMQRMRYSLNTPHAAVLYLRCRLAGQRGGAKLVVVITGVESRDVLERWVFNIETDRAALTPGCVKLMALLCANFKLHARVFIFCLLHCAGWRGSTLTVCLFVATVGFPDAVCSPRKFTPLLRSAVKSTKSHKEIQTEIQVRAGTTDW